MLVLCNQFINLFYQLLDIHWLERNKHFTTNFLGPWWWWWSRGQRARLQLWRYKFDTCWGLHFYATLCIKNENKRKEFGVGRCYLQNSLVIESNNKCYFLSQYYFINWSNEMFVLLVHMSTTKLKMCFYILTSLLQ